MHNCKQFKCIFIVFWQELLWHFTLLKTHKIYPENLCIAIYCWRNYDVIENAAFGSRWRHTLNAYTVFVLPAVLITRYDLWGVLNRSIANVLLCICQWNNIKNRSIFDEVTIYEAWWFTFYGPPGSPQCIAVGYTINQSVTYNWVVVRDATASLCPETRLLILLD